MKNLTQRTAMFSCACALSLAASANGASLLIDDATPGQIDYTWAGFDMVVFNGVGLTGDDSDTGAGKAVHQFIGTWTAPDGSPELSGIIYFVDPGQTDLIRATVEIDWTLVPGPGQETITVTITSTELGASLGLLPGAFAGLGVPIAQMSGNVTGLFRDPTTASAVSPPGNLQMAFNTNLIPQCDDPVLFLQSPNTAINTVYADVDPSTSGGEFDIVERMQVAQDVVVRSIRWWGEYAGTGSIQADADDFTLHFYADDGGTPSEFPILSMPLSPIRAGTGQFNTDLSGGDPIFVYAAHLPTPLSLSANTDYYISISNNTTNDPDDNWAWQLNDDVVGDLFYRTPTGAGAWTGLANKTAFELCGVVTSNANCPTDLNLNGGVGGADLAALLASWGACDTTAFSQAPDQANAARSDIDDQGQDNEQSENVLLGADTTFIGLRWWGIYDGGFVPDADTDDFELWLYADAGGTPGELPVAVIRLDALRTATGQAVGQFSIDEYEYEADLPLGLTLSGGETHWITIVNNTVNAPSDQWFWESSADGDGARKTRSTPLAGAWSEPLSQSDVAFELIAASCPSDFDASGSVDGADLAALLAAWGLCP